jgi:hypothetical protein
MEECLLVCAEKFEVVVLRDTLPLLCEGYRDGPGVVPANMEVGVAGCCERPGAFGGTAGGGSGCSKPFESTLCFPSC